MDILCRRSNYLIGITTNGCQVASIIGNSIFIGAQTYRVMTLCKEFPLSINLSWRNCTLYRGRNSNIRVTSIENNVSSLINLSSIPVTFTIKTSNVCYNVRSCRCSTNASKN